MAKRSSRRRARKSEVPLLEKTNKFEKDIWKRGGYQRWGYTSTRWEDLVNILSEFRKEQIALARNKLQNRTEEQVTYLVDKALDSALTDKRIGGYMRGKLIGKSGWTRGWWLFGSVMPNAMWLPCRWTRVSGPLLVVDVRVVACVQHT